jgi:hypothetical protein
VPTDMMERVAIFDVSERGPSEPSDPPASEDSEDKAAAVDGQRAADVPLQEAERAPRIYQSRFFSVLDDIVAGAVNIKPQSTILDSRPDAVARLLTLSRRVDDAANAEALYRQAYFAATLWKANPSTLGTLNAVIDDIEFSSSRNSPIYTVIRGLQASLIYLVMGGLLLFVVSSFLYSWSSSMPWEQVITGPYFRLLTSPVIVASTFGMLGAVVSVLLRLSEFENAARRSRAFLRITGVMLPVVGAVFASVTCALFASGMINFSFATGSDQKMLLNNTYFFIVIGFLSGFSERFTRGLLGTAENALIATRKEAQTVQTDGATRSTVTQSTDVIKRKVP